jgi:ADP-ribose pyrophosphatase
MFVYLATGLTQTAQNLDGDEIIEIERIPLATAIEMTIDGRIEDAKSMIGLMLAGSKLGILP